MNDIDIGEGRRRQATANEQPDPGVLVEFTTAPMELRWWAWCDENAAAMFDAIETGRQWETIARQAKDVAHGLAGVHSWSETRLEALRRYEAWLAAFRDLADRTPTPTDGGS